MKYKLRLLFLALFVCLGVTAEAADFSLLSSGVVPVIQQTTTEQPQQTRFTLIKPTVTRVSKVSTSSTTTESNRFTLTAKSQTVVLLNPPGLPELKLRKGTEQLEVKWNEDELLQGFILEYSTSVNGRPWTQVDVELTPTGRQHKVMPSQQTGTRFYRLRKQPAQ